MEFEYYRKKYGKYEPIFGAWKLSRLIGEGSYGAVFEITREDFGTTYRAALKVISIPTNDTELDSIRSSGMDEASVSTYLEQYAHKIVDEFALMAQLKGNSHVVSYEDHAVIPHENELGWDILIRMELLTPLKEYFKHIELHEREIVRLGIDVCHALELCSSYNIIHRDIKPENIFVSALGDYKIGDFGIARQLESSQSQMTKTGTPVYMAPEVYAGKQYGTSVDIYSLGVVLYRYLNYGRAPFMPNYPAQITYDDTEHALAARMSGQPLPRPLAAENEQLVAIILKAAAFNPNDRFSSPKQMREALENVLAAIDGKAAPYPMSVVSPFVPSAAPNQGGQTPPADNGTQQNAVPKPSGKKNHTGLIIAAVAMLAVAATVAVVVLNQPRKSPQVVSDTESIGTPEGSIDVSNTGNSLPEKEPSGALSAEAVEAAAVEEAEEAVADEREETTYKDTQNIFGEEEEAEEETAEEAEEPENAEDSKDEKTDSPTVQPTTQQQTKPQQQTTQQPTQQQATQQQQAAQQPTQQQTVTVTQTTPEVSYRVDSPQEPETTVTPDTGAPASVESTSPAGDSGGFAPAW